MAKRVEDGQVINVNGVDYYVDRTVAGAINIQLQLLEMVPERECSAVGLFPVDGDERVLVSIPKIKVALEK